VNLPVKYPGMTSVHRIPLMFFLQTHFPGQREKTIKSFDMEIHDNNNKCPVISLLFFCNIIYIILCIT